MEEDPTVSFLTRFLKSTIDRGVETKCVEIADVVDFYGNWMARFDARVCHSPLAIDLY